jgi:hypothetical protein
MALDQRNFDHAGFVDDQKIAVEWTVQPFLEAAILRIDLQQPMNGLWPQVRSAHSCA